MISSLYHALTGLNANEGALNVESHNIANVNTVGYKADTVSFADLMYQNSIGKGAVIQDISKDFSDGSYKTTGSSYDAAISGEGFFIVSDPNFENTYYTRAGDFRQDVNGFLTTAGGDYVQGVQATITGEMIDSSIYKEYVASVVIEKDGIVQSINTKASDYEESATDTIDPLTGRVIKTEESKVSNVNSLIDDYNDKLKEYLLTKEDGVAPTNQSTTATFANYAAELVATGDEVTISIGGVPVTQAFDTDAATTMQLLAEKISSLKGVKDATFDQATGELTINTLVPGENLEVSDAKIGINDAVIVSTDAVEGNGWAAVQASYAALEEAIAAADAQITQIETNLNTAATPNEELDVDGLTNLQLNLANLEISTDQFSDYSVDDQGIIYLTQGSNTYVVGMIEVAHFISETELKPMGGNLFAETNGSGAPIDSASASVIIDKTLELSNMELSEGLVNLMVFQRAFEANSKAITTSDEFLNVAIQLKK